ncbi:UNVERIFIED_CONTAM: hypothetical protein FKN15_001499 [Acipenser sinensis]
MAVVLEFLVRQQAIDPAPVPSASDPPPALPSVLPLAIAADPTLTVTLVVSERDEALSVGEHDAMSIEASWGGDSMGRPEPEVQEMTQETGLSSEFASETDTALPSSSVWVLMETASNFLQVPWKAVPEQHLSVFRSAQAQTPQPFPVFPDFLEEVKSSWHHPALAKSEASLASLEGAEVMGLAQFPPVDSTIAALARAPRIIESHLAHAAEVQVTHLADTGGLLTAYLDGMLQSVALPEPLASELRLVSGTLLWISGFQEQALDRSLTGLVVARRQLWLSQARVPDADKSVLLYVLISAGLYFWTSGRGNIATLPQGARGISTGGCDAPLPCSGTREGEVMASGSYHGNLDNSNPHCTTGRPEAPPSGLRSS